MVFASVLVDSDDADADMDDEMEDRADPAAEVAEATGLLGDVVLVVLQRATSKVGWEGTE